MATMTLISVSIRRGHLQNEKHIEEGCLRDGADVDVRVVVVEGYVDYAAIGPQIWPQPVSG